MIEGVVVERRRGANNRTGFGLSRAKNKPRYTRMNHNATTHCARLKRYKELTTWQPIISDGCRRRAKRQQLSVCRRVAQRNLLITSLGDNLIAFNYFI